MKTIDITDEQFNFLQDLAKEMSEQDNRYTQFPLFVVYSEVERCVGEGQGEAKRKDPDAVDSNMLCDNCAKLQEDGDELPDFCENCDPDCFWNCETEYEIDSRSGVFLTAKACDRHIQFNGYHYQNPKSFGISAWRNPEMQKLMELLFNLAGVPVPSHYK